ASRLLHTYCSHGDPASRRTGPCTVPGDLGGASVVRAPGPCRVAAASELRAQRALDSLGHGSLQSTEPSRLREHDDTKPGTICRARRAVPACFRHLSLDLALAWESLHRALAARTLGRLAQAP